MPLLRDQEALGPLFAAAGEGMGILPGAVEKDYWITQALRALSQEHSGQFIFKGGTSLSKAYRLIQRFSEDIDILVPVEADRSASTIDKLLKRMAVAAASTCGTGGPHRLRSGRGVHRTDALWYGGPRAELDPQRPQPLLPYIQLELGIHGGIQPHGDRQITTLIGRLLQEQRQIEPAGFDDLAPFDVPVLDPARTLIEKLILVTAAAVASKEDPALSSGYRVGRHYYDIHCLLGDQEIRTTLGDRGQFKKIVDDATEISRAHYGGEISRPSGGFAQGAGFKGSEELLAVIAGQYEQVMEAFYFGSDAYPTFAEVLTRVEEHNKLL